MAWDKMKKLIGDFIGRPILQYWNDVIRDYEPVQGRGGANFVELTNRTATKTVTIPAGQSLSGVIDLESYCYINIYMPDAWTEANLTFRHCPTADGTFHDLYDDAGIEVNIPAAAARSISVDVNALKLATCRYIKIRSGTSATAVNQTAERTITLVLKN